MSIFFLDNIDRQHCRNPRGWDASADSDTAHHVPRFSFAKPHGNAGITIISFNKQNLQSQKPFCKLQLARNKLNAMYTIKKAVQTMLHPSESIWTINPSNKSKAFKMICSWVTVFLLAQVFFQATYPHKIARIWISSPSLIGSKHEPSNNQQSIHANRIDWSALWRPIAFDKETMIAPLDYWQVSGHNGHLGGSLDDYSSLLYVMIKLGLNLNTFLCCKNISTFTFSLF